MKINYDATSIATSLINDISKPIENFASGEVLLQNTTGPELLMLRRALSDAPEKESVEPDHWASVAEKSDVLHRVGRRLHIIGETLNEKVMGRVGDDLIANVHDNEILSLKDKEYLMERLKDDLLVHSQVGLIESSLYMGITLEQLNILLNPTLLDVEKDGYTRANELMQVCFTDVEIASISNGHFLQDKIKNLTVEQ